MIPITPPPFGLKNKLLVFAECDDSSLQDVPHLHHHLLGLEPCPGTSPLAGLGPVQARGEWDEVLLVMIIHCILILVP